MVPALLSRPGVHTDRVGGKHILPAPLSVGSWILPLQGVWHIDTSKSLLDIPLVELPHFFQMRLERRFHDSRQ
jgi:hypothetical protein